MRLLSICAALLLLIGAASCSGSASSDTSTRDSSKVFTLSDAQIAALDAAPAADWRNDQIKPGDRLSVVPSFLAEEASSKGVSSYGHNGCGKCKYTCGKCNHKGSCKCHGDCKKCHSCKDKCGKCSHKDTCSCHGKCKEKCGHCASRCKNCTHDGNCGCHKCTCKCNCVVKCKSICYTGGKTFSTDCSTHKATATYSVHVTYTDCPHRDDEAAGHTVSFYRNGVKIGTATTDNNGDATFTDTDLAVGHYSLKAVTDCCSVCFSACVVEDCCEVECLNMESTGDTQFQASCDTHTADLAYSVHVDYTDCPDRDDEALGHDVTFSRDGAVVGHATTDANGDASFTETGVALGDYSIEASDGQCVVDFPVTVYEDCCVEECSELISSTPRFFKSECDEDYVDAEYTFHTEWSLCPGKDFDKSGYDITVTRDGVVVGTATTDANGDATLDEDDVPLGNHHVVAVLDDHCTTEFDFTGYDNCRIHACLTGYGRIPGINGDPYMVFSFATHVDQGTLVEEQRMSMTDGDISFTNVPTTWNITLGAEAYFGNDNIMFHMIDNGKAPNTDFIEVWVFDRGYHNSGIVSKGQIRSSFGYHAAGVPAWP
jgi:hypothetical protein